MNLKIQILQETLLSVDDRVLLWLGGHNFAILLLIFMSLDFDTGKSLRKLGIEERFIAQITLFSSVKCTDKLHLHLLRFDSHKIHSSIYLFTNFQKKGINFSTF